MKKKRALFLKSVVGILWVIGVGAFYQAMAENLKPTELKKRQARMEALYQAMDDSLTQFKNPDLANGEKQFMDNCFACHGNDGKRVDFDRGPGVRFMGTTANEDIELFWAMANFGDESRGMGAFEEEIPLKDLLDIAAFVRTLPVK